MDCEPSFDCTLWSVRSLKGDEETQTVQDLDLKALQFEPILNVCKDVETGIATRLAKCAVNPDLKLLFLKSYNKGDLVCVDMESRNDLLQPLIIFCEFVSVIRILEG